MQSTKQSELNSAYLLYYTDYFRKNFYPSYLEKIQNEKGWEGTLSWPFFISLEWQKISENDEVDILIYGQETCWYPSSHWIGKINQQCLSPLPYKDFGSFFDPTIFENNHSFMEWMVSLNEVCCNLFDFPKIKKPDACVSNHTAWAFWNLIKEIYASGKRKIVWSNIIRFDDGYKPIRGSRITDKESFIQEHLKLIEKEIEIIKPKKIIFLVTPNNKYNLYNRIIQKINGNSWDNANENKLPFMKEYKIWTIPVLQTYHPNYLFKRMNTDNEKKRKLYRLLNSDSEEGFDSKYKELIYKEYLK